MPIWCWHTNNLWCKGGRVEMARVGSGELRECSVPEDNAGGPRDEMGDKGPKRMPAAAGAGDALLRPTKLSLLSEGATGS